MQKVASDEQTHDWDDLDPLQQHRLIIAMAGAFKIRDRDTLKRCLDLAHPKIIMPQDESYFRVHEDSGDVLRVIFTNYLR